MVSGQSAVRVSPMSIENTRAQLAVTCCQTASAPGGLAFVYLRERQCAVAGADADTVPGQELTLQDALRQRILDLLLDSPFQRPRAIDRIEARLAQEVARAVIEADVHVALGQALAQV